MAQPRSVPIDALRIHDKDSNQMAQWAKAQVQWSDQGGVNILRWEDDGGQAIDYRDRADCFTLEPAKPNNQPIARPTAQE